MTIAQDSSDPTGVVDTSPRGSSGAARARERKAAAALALKKKGHDWEEIAEELGFPTGRHALIACELALENELKTIESQQFLRKMASDRLERMVRSVWKKATNPEDPEHLAAVDRVRMLVGDHARILGYEAPKKAVVSTPSEARIAAWVSQAMQAETPGVEEQDIFDVESWEEDEDAPPAE